MRTKKLRSTLLAAAIVLVLSAGTVPAAATVANGAPDAVGTYTELHVGTRPESVSRGSQGKLYVSVQNGTVPGDGVIVVVDGNTVSTFATGLDEPKGVAFTGEYLIVADLARIWKIDAVGNATVLVDNSAQLTPPFYNDVAVAPHGSGVLVSEMGGRAFARDPATGQFWPIGSPQAQAIPVTSKIFHVSPDGSMATYAGPSPDLLIANGIATRHGLVYATDMFNGHIDVITPAGRVRTLASGFRGADGLAVDRWHRIYVSSYDQGRVWQLSPTGKKVRLLVDGLGFAGAADLIYDDETRSLLMPSTTRGSLLTIPLN